MTLPVLSASEVHMKVAQVTEYAVSFQSFPRHKVSLPEQRRNIQDFFLVIIF
jgi:hypothetical protein